MHGLYSLPVNGLFSIPLQVFLTMVPPPDPARLTRLEQGLDRIARDHDLSDRETRTLKDSLVEPFRQEGMPIGPDTVQWLHMMNRRLLALPPGVVSAGAELQWTTLGLSRYASGVTFTQYLQGLTGGKETNQDRSPVVHDAAASSTVAKKARKRTARAAAAVVKTPRPRAARKRPRASDD